ncbi:3-dehydroquinate synthase [Basilea psittacipulmonis]|uniref:3-dehydroquinate synthase n=1 Tax=Basilea psittacipulmonis DSM 24701 TaxID=1072685 RepID=A0A077DF63_9BURK|nr:3-dehydroquinate synthase [Basilea psittacipulmonis]AIL32057.1 3-dehydroquinate synthase [Basilea psittacipulmonis DSM 24701]
MSTLFVHTSDTHYPIKIGRNNFEDISSFIPANTSSIFVLSNTTVYNLYGNRLNTCLNQLNKPIHTYCMPDGEQYKNIDILNEAFTHMLKAGLDRRSVLVALGGGVVGDLAGFASACYMRGIRFIQVPTTILSQVDSSVGGKTAINHPLGKNMIGAFYQPIAVNIDVDVIQTLPDREVSAGLAEVVKYGLIMDAEFFDWCEENVQALRQRQPQALIYAIQKSCECKAKIVSEDEKEQGRRALLNLGHTFGHAIEAGLGFGTWLHGEAVACGIIQAAELSHEVYGLPKADILRIRQLFERMNCPTMAPNLGTDKWLDYMRHDKKSIGKEIHYILLKRIGEAVMTPVKDELVSQVIERTVEA